jgi:hypothetical protein
MNTIFSPNNERWRETTDAATRAQYWCVVDDGKESPATVKGGAKVA